MEQRKDDDQCHPTLVEALFRGRLKVWGQIRAGHNNQQRETPSPSRYQEDIAREIGNLPKGLHGSWHVDLPCQ